MSQVSSDNKRIAKNTLMLYVRMFLIMGVSLYTSRVVLQTLGVDDYGIFNVVGGFVAMLSYLNSVFVDATQRFISFTLGKGNDGEAKRVFSTAISIHLLIAVIILVVAETFGLWFINEKLIIDPGRMIAANWVYQCTILSLLFTILSIPYTSSIVAHEHMHIYAYTSVVEALLKLGIVFLLLWLPGDKLILYSILFVLVSIFIPVFNAIYCRIKFEECRFSIGIDRSLFKEMFGYAGWVLVGNLGFSFKDQFSNIIMNLFLGTTINAARGIATQVNGIVSSFANNFMTALSPQITKNYASNDYSRCQQLITSGARYSFFLMSLIVIPLIVNIDYVLQLWLGVVPEYASEFIIITLIASVFYAASKTLTVGLQATGDIKLFQIGISIIMLLELPIAYLLLKLKYPPFFALLPAIFTNILGIFYRVFLLNKQVPDFCLSGFVLTIFVKCLPLSIIGFGISRFINHLFNMNFGTFILSTSLSIFVYLILVYCFGINKTERALINGFLNNRILKKGRDAESNN